MKALFASLSFALFSFSFFPRKQNLRNENRAYLRIRCTPPLLLPTFKCYFKFLQLINQPNLTPHHIKTPPHTNKNHLSTPFQPCNHSPSPSSSSSPPQPSPKIPTSTPSPTRTAAAATRAIRSPSASTSARSSTPNTTASRSISAPCSRRSPYWTSSPTKTARFMRESRLIRPWLLARRRSVCCRTSMGASG